MISVSRRKAGRLLKFELNTLGHNARVRRREDCIVNKAFARLAARSKMTVAEEPRAFKRQGAGTTLVGLGDKQARRNRESRPVFNVLRHGTEFSEP